MTIAVIGLMARIDKREALLEILRFVEEHVRTRMGCLGCGVFEAADGTKEIIYVEQWRSAKDLHAHIQSGLYLHILNAIELGCEAPRIGFYEVSQTRSMELIEELRG
jgi:quinol monooxygenase YgiN